MYNQVLFSIVLIGMLVYIVLLVISRLLQKKPVAVCLQSRKIVLQSLSVAKSKSSLLSTRHGIGYPIWTRKLYCVSSSSLDKRVMLLCEYNEGDKTLKITLYLQGSFTLLSRLELLTQYNFRVQIGYPMPCLLSTQESLTWGLERKGTMLKWEEAEAVSRVTGQRVESVNGSLLQKLRLIVQLGLSKECRLQHASGPLTVRFWSTAFKSYCSTLAQANHYSESCKLE